MKSKENNADSPLAKDAMESTMQWVSNQHGKCSLDDIVQLLRKQPGAVNVVDQRPLVMVVTFADGSGVGVNREGLDLLQPTAVPPEKTWNPEGLVEVYEEEALDEDATEVAKADDDEELGALLTPEGNEAQEKCPICGRLNSPGACDHCEHFFGACWDGEIMWSEQFDQFCSTWEDFQNSFSEMEQASPAFRKWAIKLSKTNKHISKIVQLALNEESPSEALMGLVDFQHGPTIETDGMLSGSGFSLYMEDRTPLWDMTEKVNSVLSFLESAKNTAEQDNGGND